VAEDDQSKARRRGLWRRVMIGITVCVALLIILHRPILRGVVRQMALRYAAKENLKADFRVEGNPLGRVTIRNRSSKAARSDEVNLPSR
jgi:hypothetical protein